MFLWLGFLSRTRDDNVSEPSHVLPPQNSESVPPPQPFGANNSDAFHSGSEAATATVSPPEDSLKSTDARGDVSSVPLPNPSATVPEKNDDDNENSASERQQCQ